MSLIIPELKLTYLEGSNPKHYGLNIKINSQQTHPYLILDNDIDTMVNPNDIFVISVEMGESSEGVDSKDIDMGPIAFDSDESLIEVKLIQNDALVGKGRVRVKEAQQESRPIK